MKLTITFLHLRVFCLWKFMSHPCQLGKCLCLTLEAWRSLCSWKTWSPRSLCVCVKRGWEWCLESPQLGSMNSYLKDTGMTGKVCFTLLEMENVTKKMHIDGEHLKSSVWTSFHLPLFILYILAWTLVMASVINEIWYSFIYLLIICIFSKFLVQISCLI